MMAKLDIDFKLIRLGSDNTKGIPGEPPLDPPEPVDHEAIRKRRDQKQRDDEILGEFNLPEGWIIRK
jgi:hypothetical protein